MTIDTVMICPIDGSDCRMKLNVIAVISSAIMGLEIDVAKFNIDMEKLGVP